MEVLLTDPQEAYYGNRHAHCWQVSSAIAGRRAVRIHRYVAPRLSMLKEWDERVEQQFGASHTSAEELESLMKPRPLPERRYAKPSKDPEHPWRAAKRQGKGKSTPDHPIPT